MLAAWLAKNFFTRVCNIISRRVRLQRKPRAVIRGRGSYLSYTHKTWSIRATKHFHILGHGQPTPTNSRRTGTYTNTRITQTQTSRVQQSTRLGGRCGLRATAKGRSSWQPSASLSRPGAAKHPAEARLVDCSRMPADLMVEPKTRKCFLMTKLQPSRQVVRYSYSYFTEKSLKSEKRDSRLYNYGVHHRTYM